MGNLVHTYYYFFGIWQINTIIKENMAFRNYTVMKNVKFAKRQKKRKYVHNIIFEYLYPSYYYAGIFILYGYARYHYSEIRGLHSTKCSSETLQNWLYFMFKKTHVVFFVFHFVQFYIFTLWMPWSYADIDQGIHKVKI